MKSQISLLFFTFILAFYLTPANSDGGAASSRPGKQKTVQNKW